MKLSAIILVLVMVALMSCSQKHYTEEDVRTFVVPGTTRAAIIKRFGESFIDEKNPKFEDGSTEIDEIMYFDLPPAPLGVKEDFVFSGFQVRLKNGKAVRWFSTHRSN
jgi:hypothetical protein